ncbi:MAG: SRPBCC family protein [Chloroflexi bacterium]|nr:SRPBCC family protein [Chloroflexota bacterium]
MGTVTVNAPVEKVFEAICDLTRHANWAAHDITITADQEGTPAVGDTYSSVKGGGKPDRITVTSMTPNESLGFHVVMPNSWELDWQMSVTADGDGTRVERKGRVTTIPWYMAPMKLMFGMVASMDESKMAKKMKADLESSG